MPSNHDVIIVGSGPAGSTAATALARRGRDVLLLDRAAFPRDKACGDGIPPGTVGILHDLGMAETLRAADFHRIDALRLVSARGRDWRLDFTPRRDGADFFIAPRVRFDEVLRRHAIASGARFQRAQVRAPLLENGRVVGVRAEIDGVENEIAARVVIGADGATSAIARALVPEKPPESHRAVAIQLWRWRRLYDNLDADVVSARGERRSNIRWNRELVVLPSALHDRKRGGSDELIRQALGRARNES